ncbi:flavoprotein [Nocardiopsis mangrovi]|uniref:Flavoprotein n=1 Tax=Nocardiopsis mangrovi TaxID=1179818 RepID=A0ABV9E4G5_9ACTN
MAKTLYLIVSGAMAREPVSDLVRGLQGADWRVSVLSTPMGTRFHDPAELAELTGEPVRVEFRMPGTGAPLPPPDAVLACPLTFTSVNKIANGIADGFAIGLVCEMFGFGVPTLLVPHCKPDLASHPAFARSLATLRAVPRVTVLHDPAAAHPPSWGEVTAALEEASAAGRGDAPADGGYGYAG